MTTLNILRILQLLAFMVVTTQLTYYLFAMGDALKLISIEGFLEQRKVVDALVVKRLRVFYYLNLALCLAVLLLTARQPGSPVFITSCIAFLCLVTDITMALKGNGPINALVNTWTPGAGGSTDWGAVRDQWIGYIKCRGLFSLLGFLSLLAGWVLFR